jgi:hypothetical protein
VAQVARTGQVPPYLSLDVPYGLNGTAAAPRALPRRADPSRGACNPSRPVQKHKSVTRAMCVPGRMPPYAEPQ